MKRLIFFVLALSMVTGLFGQRPTIILTFTAVDSMAYIQVDSIKVMNRSQGVDTILNYPDTVLILEFPVGVHDAVIENKGFGVFQNYPNPVADQTTIALYVPEKDRVCLLVTNPIGQVVIMTEHLLDQGIHSFRFTPGGGNLYFFTAEWHGVKSTIKIICTGNLASGRGMMDYTGQAPMTHQTKTASVDPQFFFIPGDTLLFIGYADSLASGMLDSPEESHDYTFQFATNIPCPGTPIVEYAGQVYNTIQVFSQCWLKENLNVGEMIPGTMNQSNNGTIEKYCQFNDTSYCKTYGGLYQWDEMMQYTSLQGTQGICPPGWHIPTDEETKILEGATDSLFSLGDPEWDNRGYRGWDTGKNLKTIDGWPEDGGGTDLFGFSVLPGGYRKYDGTFHGGDYNAEIWSSTDDMINAPWRRRFDFDYGKISRNYNSSRQYGFSVRCIRDENNN